MRLFSIVLIVMFLLPGAISFAADQSFTRKPFMHHRHALLAMDFSCALADAHFMTFEETRLAETESARRLARVLEGMIGNGIPDRPLSLREQGILLGWGTAPGNGAVWWGPVQMLADYYSKKQHLPTDSADLLLDRFTEKRYEQISGLPLEERLYILLPFINPITGRLYDTFEARSWAPGAFNITIVDDPDLVAQYHFPASDALRLSLANPAKPPKVVWKIRIWGEEPGTVLLDYDWVR